VSAAGRLVRFKLGKKPRDVDRAFCYLVRSAYRNVPYYSRAWSASGVRAESVRRAQDLARLPVTPRDRLLGSEGQGFLARGTDTQRRFRSSTSGSTANPVTVYFNWPELYFRRVSLLAAVRKNLKFRYPLTIVDVGAMRGAGRRDLAQRLGIVRVVHLRRTMPVDEQAERIQRTPAQLVQGRPSSLALLVDELLRRGVHAVHPQTVVSFGEVLHPPVRTLLEETFACPVADYYNAEEVGNIAWQCPRCPGVMHVNHDTCMLEVVGDDGEPMASGAEGRVLVTNLYNCTMPFIRYELGDRAALEESGEPCPCGHVGTTIRLASGRDDDFFVLPDGRLVSPRMVFQAVWDALPVTQLGQQLLASVQAFQIEQTAPDAMVVRLVPGSAYTPALWQDLESSVKVLHPTMTVRVELVAELSAAPSGKLRQVVSRVPRQRPAWDAQDACVRPG